MDGYYKNGEIFIKINGHDAECELEMLQKFTNVRWVGGTMRPLDVKFRKIGYLVFWCLGDGTPDFLNMMQVPPRLEDDDPYISGSIIRSNKRTFMDVNEFIEKYFNKSSFDNIDTSSMDVLGLL